MKSRISALGAAIGCGLIWFSSSAFAETTGWIDANKLQSFDRKVLKRGYLPVSMKCKNANNTVGMNRKNTMVKVTYRKNTNKTPWAWAWGSSVKRTDIKFKKRGYKRVSYSSFRRPSGLRMPCAIWHKKR